MDKIKDLLEFASKSPQVNELGKQCFEIRQGRKKSISKKVIDDAFDAYGVIVKKISNNPEEMLELQKMAVKHYLCNLIRSHDASIEE